MWMRYTLARMTPVLRHLLGSGETRPFELYGALVEAAGALAAFRLREAAELPAYDHENPWPCFSALLAFIDGALEEVAPTFTELRLRYDAAKKAYVTGDLTVDLVNPRNRFVLGVKATMESKELVSWVAQKGKAGSAAQISQLLMFNVPGVPLEHLPGMPSDVAGPPGAEYFKIDPHGDRWGKVRDEFSFALSLGPLADADVRLFIVAAG
jgi:type VI secretion system protein ImpJ